VHVIAVRARQRGAVTNHGTIEKMIEGKLIVCAVEAGARNRVAEARGEQFIAVDGHLLSEAIIDQDGAKVRQWGTRGGFDEGDYHRGQGLLVRTAHRAASRRPAGNDAEPGSADWQCRAGVKRDPIRPHERGGWDGGRFVARARGRKPFVGRRCRLGS
jgi:hypothetical protein